MEIETECK